LLLSSIFASDGDLRELVFRMNTAAASGGPNCHSGNCVLVATSGLQYRSIIRMYRLWMQLRRSSGQTRNSVRLLTKRQSLLPFLRVPSIPSAPDLSVVLLKQTLVLATSHSPQQNHRSAVPPRIKLRREKQSHWSVRIQVRTTATLHHIQHRSAVPPRTMHLQVQSHWSVRLQAAIVAVLAASLRHATMTLLKLKRSVNAITVRRRRRRVLRLGLLTVVETWAIPKSCDIRTASERCVQCML